MDTPPPDGPAGLLLGRLVGVRRTGTGWSARCPSHDDRTNSLTVDAGDVGRVLVRCHAGCRTETVVAALGLGMADLFPVSQRGEGVQTPANRGATVQRSAGCTLVDYAAAKRLDVGRLRAFGLSDVSYVGAPAVRIPYRDPGGLDAAVRFRMALEKGSDGDDRFRWKSGAKPCLYGLDRLDLARERGYAVLVEGESDCHTLWCHGEPALGLPGATNWREGRDALHLDGIPVVYVVLEPDTGGEAVQRWLAASAIRDRARLVDLGGFKDPSALYLDDPERFPEQWRAALDVAVPWAEEADAAARTEREAAWVACADLARDPDIPARAATALAASGVAGEARTLKLLFLVLVSRFLPRPVSAAIKGPSSGGKSHLVERVLALFPPGAYYALSAMSERALAYDDEPLAHRFLVVYEAAGLSGEMASYLVRSLLSEGRVRYVTVEKTKDGLRPRLIEREGPTGLLVTTTAVRLHPENETRLLSVPVTDTPAQTRAVFRALAAGPTEPLDAAPWHALQVWLSGAEHRVAIPYAGALAEQVSTVAVRLRRDFGAVLALVSAHALMHQASRDRDAEGRVVAALDDYQAVRALVADLVAEGVEATVPPTVRETVDAVERLIAPAAGGSLIGRVRQTADPPATVSISAIAKALGIDKSAASRRVRAACDFGYLKNLETVKGRPSKVAIGDPLPADAEVLPAAEALADRCTVDGVAVGKPPPSPLADDSGPAGWTCVDCGRVLPAGRRYRCAACAALAA